jgi:hypothetical protein
MGEFYSPSRGGGGTGNAHTLVPVRWDGRAHPLGKRSPSQKHSPVRPMAFRRAAGASRECNYLLTHVGDSAVGVVLPVALFSIMGSVLLFFDNQLLNCRLWRCYSPANVADLGPGRKCHWRAHVRLVREPPVRYRNAAR